jgi:hypothetical protein
MYLILNLKMNLPMKKNEKLFFINVALILPFLIQYIDIYLQKNSFSNNNGVIFLDLHFRALLYLDVNLLIIIIILTIIWRNQISKYGKKLLIQLILFSHYTLDKLYNLAKKINPFKIILYKLTIRNLNKNDQAVFFARNFIIIQSEKIRTNLPSMVPKTVDQSFRNIFLQDIDRMYQLLQINKIKTYSKDAVLKFVMSIAKPIIVDMQRTLQEHITLELLKKSNDSKNLKVDIDDLWSKTNKILSQWESTFGDAELKYKDTLLHK